MTLDDDQVGVERDGTLMLFVDGTVLQYCLTKAACRSLAAMSIAAGIDDLDAEVVDPELLKELADDVTVSVAKISDRVHALQHPGDVDIDRLRKWVQQVAANNLKVNSNLDVALRRIGELVTEIRHLRLAVKRQAALEVPVIRRRSK